MAPTPEGDFEEVWRRESAHVLGALVRRYGHFDRCEDALQEALVSAALHWPREGLPSNPRGWLIRAASRRLIDAQRSDVARSAREAALAEQDPDLVRHEHSGFDGAEEDDSLHVLLLCCHPRFPPPRRWH
ncbi:hypothetical protein GCM10029992_06670 [Glycomyces albus]